MELVSGVTYAEFSEQYRARLNASLTEWANPVYDGVWSLALALNNSIPRLSDIRLDLILMLWDSFESVELVVHPALASLFVFVMVVALVLVVGAHVMTLANINCYRT